MLPTLHPWIWFSALIPFRTQPPVLRRSQVQLPVWSLSVLPLPRQLPVWPWPQVLLPWSVWLPLRIPRFRFGLLSRFNGRLFPFAATAPSTSSGGLFLGLTGVVELVEVNQFYHGHIGIIAQPISQFDDTGVTSRSVGHFLGNFAEQFGDRIFVP